MSCELFPIFLLHVEVGVSFLPHKPAAGGRADWTEKSWGSENPRVVLVSHMAKSWASAHRKIRFWLDFYAGYFFLLEMYTWSPHPPQ